MQLPAMSLEAAIGIAGGSLLGAVVMLVLWLRARSALGHARDDLRAQRQEARREQLELERRLEGIQQSARALTVRMAEAEAVLATLSTAPMAESTRAVALEIGTVASEVASTAASVGRCRRLMDDLQHDMHRAIDVGRRLSPPGDRSGGFFEALEEGLVALDTAFRDTRDQVDRLTARTDTLTQRGGALASVAQTHAAAVGSLSPEWQRLETATSVSPPASS